VSGDGVRNKGLRDEEDNEETGDKEEVVGKSTSDS
jgi:hypothetical protein